MSKVYLRMFFPDVPMASGWKIWVDGKRVLRVNSITFAPKNESVWDLKMKERRVPGGTMRYVSFEADVRIETGEFGLKDIYLERKYGECEDETKNGSNNERDSGVLREGSTESGSGECASAIRERFFEV